MKQIKHYNETTISQPTKYKFTLVEAGIIKEFCSYIRFPHEDSWYEIIPGDIITFTPPEKSKEFIELIEFDDNVVHYKMQFVPKVEAAIKFRTMASLWISRRVDQGGTFSITRGGAEFAIQPNPVYYDATA